MVNMNVAYVRPDRNVTTLVAELNALWPGRRPDLGYLTGYPSPTNYTGHNPDNNGIVHAVDIGTYVTGDINEPDGRNLAEQLRLIGKATNRFQYLIHDMSAGAPQPMIASKEVDWEWVPYDGAAAHSDHIHISTCESWYGEPSYFYGTTTLVPESYYDNTAPWGITRGGASAQGNAITPIPEDTMTAADIQAINAHTDKQFANLIAILLDGYRRSDNVQRPGILQVLQAIPAAVWAETISRTNGPVDVKQDLANTGTAIQGLTAAVQSLPASVLNQTFALADGTKTNLAGILGAINAKPAAQVQVAITPEQLDQLATTLKAELPAATLAAFTAKLSS